MSNCTSYQKYKDYPNEPALFPIGVENKWGYVDIDGKIKIDLQYEEANLFKYGMALVKKNGKYGYINLKGKWKIKPKYDNGKCFYFGCAEVQKNSIKIYINRRGKAMDYKDCELSNIVAGCLVPNPPIDPQRYSVKKGEKYALTYKQTKDTTDFIFDSVARFDNDFILVEKDGMYGFHFIYLPLKTNRKVYYTGEPKFIYEDVIVKYEIWSNGIENGSIQHAEVKKNGKWGLINSQLIEVIEPRYLSMDRKLGGAFILVEFEKSKFGYIDYKGKEYFKRDEYHRQQSAKRQ